MKIGTINWNFPPEWTLEEVFKFASEAGYGGLELGLSEFDPNLNFNSTDEEMDRIKDLAKKYNLEIYSIMCPEYAAKPFSSPDESVREEAKKILKKHIEIAGYLGCESVLVIPGMVDAGVNYEDAYNRAFECINELKGFAKEKNVEIALENIHNKFLLSPMEMRDFVDKFESDFVGSYFDVGNVVYSGYPEHWIKILGKRIKKVHLKDYQFETRTFVDLLEGDVNWPEVSKAFSNAGYNGWVTAEIGSYGHYPEERLTNTYNAMKKIFK